MKKIDLGQAIAILANLGVLAGIVFLAVEERQNTETQRLSAAQQVLGLFPTDRRTESSLKAVNRGSAVDKNWGSHG